MGGGTICKGEEGNRSVGTIHTGGKPGNSIVLPRFLTCCTTELIIIQSAVPALCIGIINIIIIYSISSTANHPSVRFHCAFLFAVFLN
jgi:hypothetical protein